MPSLITLCWYSRSLDPLRQCSGNRINATLWIRSRLIRLG